MFRPFVQHAQRGRFRALQIVERIFALVLYAAYLSDEAADLHAQRGKIAFKYAARGHADGGFARGSPFENVSRVALAEFQHSRKVGMAGPHPRHRARGDVARSVRHIRPPIFVILIVNAQRDGTAQRFAVSHPRQNLRPIGFYLLPRAPAEAALAKRKLAVDLPDVDFKMRGQSLDHRNQRLSVRFARRRQFPSIYFFMLSILPQTIEKVNRLAGKNHIKREKSSFSAPSGQKNAAALRP